MEFFSRDTPGEYPLHDILVRDPVAAAAAAAGGELVSHIQLGQLRRVKRFKGAGQGDAKICGRANRVVTDDQNFQGSYLNISVFRLSTFISFLR